MLGVGAIFQGRAAFTTVLLPSGVLSLRAYYSGDTTYAAGSSALYAQTVTPRSSSGLRHAVNYFGGYEAVSMVMGDFNGDGKPDFAAVDGVTRVVTVYLGNGDGTFQAGQTYTTVTTARSIAAGDFNGDGITDLVVANQYLNSGSLSVLLGNGDGTFQQPVSYPLAANPFSLAVGDFNGDGKADVVVTENFAHGFSVLLGRGDATFEPEAQTYVGAFTVAVTIGDFNGDGIADLAVATSGGVDIYTGLGNGTFGQIASYQTGGNNSGSSMAAGDLNGDGKTDLVLASELGALILLGHGDGTFNQPVQIEANSIFLSIAFADIDGDGIPGLVGVTATNSVAVMRGSGIGTFWGAVDQPVVAGSFALAVADVDGDGTADVVVAGGGISVLLGGATARLSIAATHRGILTQGQGGIPFTITVTNGFDLAWSGPVSVTATLGPGLSATSLGGSGWTCVLATLTCTRADSLALGASYPAITALVAAASGLTGTVTSIFVVSWDSGQSSTALDSAYVHFPSSTMLGASPNPAVLGHAATLTATVTTGATGQVMFYGGTTPLGSAALSSGQAVLLTSLLPAATTSLYAAYAGDSNYGPSISAPQIQNVTPVPINGLLPPASYSVGAPPVWIGVADFNGDGKPDVVTVNSNGNAGSISVLLGNGDGTFQPAVSYPAGAGSATSGVVGDFNGDGKTDVVVASGSGLYLLAGNGDGTFQAAQMVEASHSYEYLLCADLNGDGKLDLVAVSQPNIIPLLGNGDGTFQELPSAGTLAALDGPPLAIADMNGDGKPDLVALSTSYPASANVLLGNGDGTFQSAIAGAATNLYAMAFAVGDFNGDRKPDVALVYPDGIAVLLGNGDGSLQAPIKSSLSNAPGYFALAGDFDGDGKVDLAYAGYYTFAVYLAFGNGGGTFRDGVPLPTDSEYVMVAQADLNGDGKPDFVVSNPETWTVDVFLGTQISGLTISSSHAGNFTAGRTGAYQLTVQNPAFPTTQTITITVTDTLPAGFTATSINGDGWSCTLSSLTCTRPNTLNTGQSYPAIVISVDVAAGLPASTLTNQASVTYGGTMATATDSTSIVVPSTTTLAVSPVPSALDQPVMMTATVSAGATGTVMFSDYGVPIGTASIIGAQAAFSTRLLLSGPHSLVATYAGNSANAPSSSAVAAGSVNASPASSFQPAVNYTTGAGPSAIATGDFNLDGITDLVTANSSAGTVSVFLGKGDGTFGNRADFPAGTSPTFVVVGDFNNDGKPDIAVASAITNSFSILPGNGNGTFQPALPYSFGVRTTSLGVADFYGTGQASVVATNDSNNVLGLASVNKDGTIHGSLGPTLLSGLASVIYDFNNDGRADFAVWSGSGVWAYLGNGDGTFQEAATGANLLSAATNLAVGDLNADGNPDIVAAIAGGVQVLLGNGDGTFQTPAFYSTSAQATFVFCTDINGDGKADVVAVGSSGGAEVLLGNGDGTLQPPVPYSVGSSPVGVAAGDFNGDGITDLAVVNSQGNSVSVLLGALVPVLTVTSSHPGSFAVGQVGAAYTITVSDAVASTSGAVTVTDTLPAGLAATAIAGAGWNCSLATLTCTRSDALAASGSYPAITLTVTVTANAPGSVTNQMSVSGGGAIGGNSGDITSIAVGTPIGFQTSPAGLQFSVDSGPAQTAPLTLNLVPGPHTIAVAAVQAGTPGTQCVFTGWSDAGADSHTINVTGSPAAFTASFKTQYQLATSALPEPGGLVSPATGAFYDAGSNVTVGATANAPYQFSSWSGAGSGSTSPITIMMNSPQSITANFAVPGFTCAVTGDTTASIADVQQLVNEALGTASPVDDLNRDHVVNLADVQKVIDATLGRGCIY